MLLSITADDKLNSKAGKNLRGYNKPGDICYTYSCDYYNDDSGNDIVRSIGNLSTLPNLAQYKKPNWTKSKILKLVKAKIWILQPLILPKLIFLLSKPKSVYIPKKTLI